MAQLKRPKLRAADAGPIPGKTVRETALRRELEVLPHSIERSFDDSRVHPSTQTKLLGNTDLT